ncbi:MAG: class I SAM-dependent methyltransferase [Acidobacteria bacterium]|nr:class I SAM-dependent methyltransferase [Acidobacteriota bacterium]
MYHYNANPGGSPEMWDSVWKDSDGIETAQVFFGVDPLQSLFEQYARAGSYMLEGGCGNGQYVVHMADRGVNIVGLDFARDALSRLRAYDSRLKLCEGDVAALPFLDETFDLYYSGGVVEHFEAGAETALKEARRVLRPGGALLISVPYYSPLRRLLSPFKMKLWKRVSRSEVDTADKNGGPQFFQYAYTRREFEVMLTAAGLRVVKAKGYSILWGLYDISLLQRIMSARIGGNNNKPQSTTAVEPTKQPARRGVSNQAPSLLKRLFVGEDDSIPVAGIAVRALRSTCANMMMYICVRSEDK